MTIRYGNRTISRRDCVGVLVNMRYLLMSILLSLTRDEIAAISDCVNGRILGCQIIPIEMTPASPAWNSLLTLISKLRVLFCLRVARANHHLPVIKN